MAKGASDTPDLVAYRRRQVSIAKLLEEMLGPLQRARPRAWPERAYWMLAGLIYERLADLGSEVNTDELVALAKALAEHRRIDPKARSERKAKPRRAKGAKLQNGARAAIREVYGLEWPAPLSDSAKP